jgi:glycosyltransferase involved in cell wall biosynthesis
MRVAFDARVLDRRELATRGIGRYAHALLDALRADGRDVAALSDLARPWMPDRAAELLEHVLLARDARHARADVLHSPSIDFVTMRPGMPYVVTVHDLVPLKHPERYLRTGVKHRVRYAAVRRATRLIVPTHAVAHDCERLLGVGGARIDVIPEAAAPAFRPIEDPRALLGGLDLPERFALWVGGLDPPDPRKRVEELVRAAARLGTQPLVLAGAAGRQARALASPGAVILTGRVTDDELAALYNAADCLIFPSEEEGFGLPIAEALACGTPAVAFAIDSLRELYDGNGGVTLVEAGDFDALLGAAAAHTGKRATPSRRTWMDVARETWATYESSTAATL